MDQCDDSAMYRLDGTLEEIDVFTTEVGAEDDRGK